MGFVDAVVCLGTILAICLFLLSQWDLGYNTVYAIDVVSSTIVPKHVLFTLRCLMGITAWRAMYFIATDTKGFTVYILMQDDTIKKLLIKHLERFTVFTVWCWSIIGVYFFLVLCVTVQHFRFSSSPLYETSIVSPLLLQFTWIVFEVAYTCALLVTLMVTFVILPNMHRKHIPTHPMFTYTPLLTHNANVIFMTAELFLNKLSFHPSHVLFVIIFALAYVLFAWYWYYVTGVFYYIFLDYNSSFVVPIYIALCIGVRTYSVLRCLSYICVPVQYFHQYLTYSTWLLIQRFSN